MGKQVGVAVLPQRCAPLSPGSIPGPGAVRAFGFQSILASTGFSPGSPVFLLHLKLGFLNKSVSGIIWSYSVSLSAYWQPMALRLESFGRYVARYLKKSNPKSKPFRI